MWKKVQAYIRTWGMLVPGDRVITALSGGADSVCLLWMLKQLKEICPIELRAVHVHHGLRGAEADRDMRFVENLCADWEIPLTTVHCKAADYAAEHGISTEEAGRILRYQAFEKEAETWQNEFPGMNSRIWIAVAHHQDDQAETILHHLLRGSGLKGLSGIRPIQGNRIRPLLCVSREEILEELSRHGISWCEDSTNRESDYTRNRIRNQMIPMMKEQVNARSVENIVHAGEIFAQADAYLQRQADRIWKTFGTCIGTERAEIPLVVLNEQEPIIQTYLIRCMLDLITPGWKDITAKHFEQIAALAKKQVGSRLDLPCAMAAVRSYDMLIVCKEAALTEKTLGFQPAEVELPLPDAEPKTVGNLTFSAFSIKKGSEIPKNRYTKWFDYDKINSTLFVRTRESGDYFSLPGGGTKTAARYMIDEKIPRQERDRILLIAEKSHILWVLGGRISEYYKITETTKTILQVEFNGGKEDGRESSCITV